METRDGARRKKEVARQTKRLKSEPRNGSWGVEKKLRKNGNNYRDDGIFDLGMLCLPRTSLSEDDEAVGRRSFLFLSVLI